MRNATPVEPKKGHTSHFGWPNIKSPTNEFGETNLCSLTLQAKRLSDDLNYYHSRNK